MLNNYRYRAPSGAQNGMLTESHTRVRNYYTTSIPDLLTALLAKIGACLFLLTIPLVPLVIVILRPEDGGFWVAGFVVGIVTVPILSIVAMQAIAMLLRGAMIFSAFAGYAIFILLISVAAAAYGLAT
jgi:hypothetical protein